MFQQYSPSFSCFKVCSDKKRFTLHRLHKIYHCCCQKYRCKLNKVQVNSPSWLISDHHDLHIIFFQSFLLSPLIHALYMYEVDFLGKCKGFTHSETYSLIIHRTWQVAYTGLVWLQQHPMALYGNWWDLIKQNLRGHNSEDWMSHLLFFFGLWFDI